ncbi:MAG: glycosyltransferase family 4 protein [Lachnospiraceae bacterium]|jgi:glycosyltransferase involved in cell wall biosynthesis|nr:glycosyltransferase family 4 protein [Lachnospiraceae bacterium]
MKKVLIIATIEGFLKFEIGDMQILQEMGYEVHIAVNSENVRVELPLIGVKKHQIDFERNPFARGNIKAYRQLCELAETEEFALIHCHTPVGGVMGRVIGHKYKIKVIYTAHGFHFYEGAPIKNWLLYFPVEYYLSKWTDILVTINKEDFFLAEKKFKMNKIVQIPGVGLDIKTFHYQNNFPRNEYRERLGIEKGEYLILSVGELNDNKNHALVIKAVAALNNKKIHYYIAGVGKNRDIYMNLANKLGIINQIHLLGFRNDIMELNHAADIFVFPSIREGMGMASLEALACGTIVLGMDIRGVREYVIEGETGFLFDNQVDSCMKCIKKSLDMSIQEKEKMREKCIKQAKNYSREYTDKIMRKVYKEI